jgi:16S rRNA (cytosine1402-N4)-methyltransferase
MTEHSAFFHEPVLLNEVMSFLDIHEGDFVIDATAGGGGHLRAIAKAVGDTGQCMAFDKDPRAHLPDAAGGVVAEWPNRASLIHSPFSAIRSYLETHVQKKPTGLLCDLGVSSWQLDTATRGFSFLGEGPLDMRMDPTKGQTAFELIESVSETELANIIFNFGEERFSRRIAKRIKDEWPIEDSTRALAELIRRAVPRFEKRIHPATRTFQALRIAVNGELDELKMLLDDLPYIMAPGGRVVMISFHSLEDRLVKQAFKRGEDKKAAPGLWKILTKKPVIATDEETRRNPRARSAKMRAIQFSLEKRV